MVSSNNVWRELEEELKQKAKSGFEVIDSSDRLGETCNAFNMDIDRCYQCLDRNCEFFNNKQWVRLEDVLSILQQLKQNIVDEIIGLIYERQREIGLEIVDGLGVDVTESFIQDLKELLRKNEG